MPRMSRVQGAAIRQAKLDEIRRQVADGTLVIRQATPAERKAWAIKAPPPAPPVKAAAPVRPRQVGPPPPLLPAVVRILEEAFPTPVSERRVTSTLRKLPDPRPRFGARALRDALAAAVADPASPVVRVPGRGFSVRAGDDG